MIDRSFAPSEPAPHRLSPHVTRLGCHHLNLYLIEGTEEAAIFEVGTTVTSSLVLDQLRGMRFPVEKIGRAVMSHAHADHSTGQGGLLAGLPEAELVLSREAVDFLGKPATAVLWQQKDAYTSMEVIIREGLPGFFGGVEPLLPGPVSIAAAGEVIDLGGVSVHLNDAAGHVPGGFWAHIPEDGVVLASDSAGFRSLGAPGYPLFFAGYAAYLETLAAIADLQPEVLALGHQCEMLGREAARYLADTEALMHQVRDELRKMAAHGRTEAEMIDWLMERFWIGELTVYSEEGMRASTAFIVRRALEAD